MESARVLRCVPAGGNGAVGAPVEAAEPRHHLLAATGNGIEVVLHSGREGIIHEVPEAFLHEAHHGERRPRGDQRGALLPHVVPLHDGVHDAGVGGRTTNAQFLKPLDQRRFGVPRRGLGGVGFTGHIHYREHVTLGEFGKLALVITGVVGLLDVHEAESGMGDDRPAGGQFGIGS